MVGRPSYLQLRIQCHTSLKAQNEGLPVAFTCASGLVSRYDRIRHAVSL